MWWITHIYVYIYIQYTYTYMHIFRVPSLYLKWAFMVSSIVVIIMPLMCFQGEIKEKAFIAPCLPIQKEKKISEDKLFESRTLG